MNPDRLDLRARLRTLYPPEDPYPEWARRQFADGLTALRPDGGDGEVALGVYGWERVRECFRHPDVGLSDVYRRRLQPVTGRGIHCLDPPEHTELRSRLEPLFREAVGELSDRDLRNTIGTVVQALPDAKSLDLVERFTTVYPFAVLANLLDLPAEDLPRFRARTLRFALDYMFGGSAEGGDGAKMQSRNALRSYLRARLEERRRRPRGGDLLSRLIHETSGGRSLEDEEILSFLLHLAPAATLTTAMATGMLLYGLLTHPEQERLLREDPSRVSDAVEEGLRWAPPFAVVERAAHDELTLDGIPVEGGARLMLHVGAANRDPARFENPHEFDLERSSVAHLSFAAGPHVCLGESLARREMRTAIRLLYERFVGLRLDPDGGNEVGIGGRYWRGIPGLPVVAQRSS